MPDRPSQIAPSQIVKFRTQSKARVRSVHRNYAPPWRPIFAEFSDADHSPATALSSGPALSDRWQDLLHSRDPGRPAGTYEQKGPEGASLYGYVVAYLQTHQRLRRFLRPDLVVIQCQHEFTERA